MKTIKFKIITILLPLSLMITSCKKEITQLNPPELTKVVCSSLEHVDNNICINNTKACESENGSGQKEYLNGSWGSCIINLCNSSFHLDSSSCVSNTAACIVQNGIGAKVWNGSSYGACAAVACSSGFHNFSNSCARNIQSCAITNGTGAQEWNGISDYGVCNVETCATSFHNELNSCLNNIQSCSNSNGSGVKSWNGSSYSSCALTSCASGFELISDSCYSSCLTTQHRNIITKSCDSNSIDCSSSILNSTVATSSWNGSVSQYDSCLVASCLSPYVLDSNSCPSALIVINSTSSQYVIKNNSLSLTASGAIIPYAYSIDLGVGSVSSAGVFSSSVVGSSSVKVSDNGTQSATAAINVVDQITGTALAIIQGSTSQLNVSGGSGVFNYFSSNDLISTVDANGLVTAISPGTASILVSDGNNSSSSGYSNAASIVVTVNGIQLLSNNLLNISSTDTNVYIDQLVQNLPSDGSQALSSSFQSASNVSVFNGNSVINFSSTNSPLNAYVSSYTLAPTILFSSISTSSGVSSILIPRSSITTSQNIVLNAVSNGITVSSNSVSLEHLSSIRLSNTAYNTIQNFTDMGNAGNYKIFRNYNSKNAIKIYSYNMTNGEVVQLSAGTSDTQNDWLSSFPSNNLPQANNRVYYISNNSSGYSKLFSTDGVSINQVSNVNGDGASDTFPSQNATGSGIYTYFWTTNSTGHYKLFRSDGLSLVQITNTSGSDSVSDWPFTRNPPVVTILNGNVYFSSNNRLGYSKLFKSDNTECSSTIPAVCNGTAQVSNTMKNDSANDIIGSLVTAGNYVYFDASTGPSSFVVYVNNYPKLFKTDGSSCSGSAPVVCSGSVQVSNVAGSGAGDSPYLITYSAPYVYFYAFSGQFDNRNNSFSPVFKIYRTTGTPCSSVCSGTAQVSNTTGADTIDDSVSSIIPGGDGGIYFIARSAQQSYKLFNAGAGSCSGSSPVVCTSTNQVANTTASNSRSDNINSIYASHGIAYFTASTSSGLNKIFKTTGTACNSAVPKICSGTNQILNNLELATDSPAIYGLATSSSGVDTLYYTTGSVSMTQLYSYNSTTGNSTSYSTALGSPASISSPVYYNNGTYDGIVFAKNSVNITGWSPTNSLIPTIVPTIPTDKNADNIGIDSVNFKGNVYYSANNQYQKNKLMNYDGSVISQISNTSGASVFSDDINYITATSNGIYFVANNSSGTAKLFKFDGLIVSQVSNTSGSDSSFDNISDLVAAGGNLYFSANNTSGSQKVYKTSGEACSGSNPVVCGGTYQVTNTSGSDLISDNVSKLTMIAVGNNLYFSAMLANNTTKLFKTDGTACTGSPSVCSGTVQVSNTSGGSTESDQIAYVSSANEIVYFSASNQNSSGKLFRTDGTACVGTPKSCSGTYQVSNTRANNSGSDGVGYSIGLGNFVLFYAINPGGSKKIWKTDGSPCSGTTQIICGGVSQVSNTSGSSTVSDSLVAGASKYNSYQRIVSDGTYVYFSAQNSAGALKYYRTDGTSCVGNPVVCGGTVQIANTSGSNSISDNILSDDGRSGFIGLGANGEVYFNGKNSNGFQKPYRVQSPSCSGSNPVSCSGSIQVLNPLNNDSSNDDCLLIATKPNEAYFRCYVGYNGFSHIDKLYKVIKN